MRGAPLALIALGLCLPATAFGDHSSTERITDQSAEILRPGEWRAGLFRLEYGVPGETLNGLELGTFTFPWAVWALGAQTVNVHAKYRFVDYGKLRMAASAGLFYIDAGDALDAESTLYVFPVDIRASYRQSDRWTFGAGIEGVYGFEGGAYDEEEVSELQGAASAQQVHGVANVEWRLSRRIAIGAHARVSGVLKVTASGEGQVAIDEFTTIEGFAEGEEDISEGLGSSAGVKVHFSWKRFNLVVGASYGNVIIPVVNLVTPKPAFLPNLDLYFRF